MKFQKKYAFLVLFCFRWCILEKSSADVFEDGQPVAHEHFPFITSVQEWGVRWEHICVGNIVDQSNVLTAYQCLRRVQNDSVEMKDVKKLRVYAGAADMDRGSVEERYIMVKNFKAHPRVFSSVHGTVAFDLALLHLAQNFEFNHEILPMQLPVVDTTIHSNALCHSPGWGARWGKISKNLTLAVYRRIPRRQCYNILCQLFALCSLDLAMQEQTCAVNKRVMSSFTDLGSPLVCHGSVYGMATFKAGTNSPLILTGLAPILELVRTTKASPQTPKLAEKDLNETARAVRALEDRKRMEQWVRMLSSSQIRQVTRILLVLECVVTLKT